MSPAILVDLADFVWAYPNWLVLHTPFEALELMNPASHFSLSNFKQLNRADLFSQTFNDGSDGL